MIIPIDFHISNFFQRVSKHQPEQNLTTSNAMPPGNPQLSTESQTCAGRQVRARPAEPGEPEEWWTERLMRQKRLVVDVNG